MAFADASYFERLLTRFTVPEELFGPLSINGLEEDRYERLTTAYLPTASIAFLDEIFKANSAILNALLTLLNERELDNGAKRVRTPLVAVIGASNELPDGEELDALFDRFLLRLHVGPVTKDAFPALLALRGHATPEVASALRLTEADLAVLRSALLPRRARSDASPRRVLRRALRWRAVSPRPRLPLTGCRSDARLRFPSDARRVVDCPHDRRPAERHPPEDRSPAD